MGRRGRRPWLTIAVVALAVVATATACTGTQPLPNLGGLPSLAVPRLGASVSQYTIDEANGDLRFAITNLGKKTVTVGSARLAWSGFGTAAVQVPYGRLAPGESTGFAAPPADPHCTQPPTDRPTIDAVVDGSHVSIPLRVTVPGLLEGIYRNACAGERLSQTASVRLVVAHRQLVRDGTHFLPASVLVRRVGGTAGVTVLGVDGSVLLSLDPLRSRGELPERLAGGASMTRVPVLLSSGSRCDPHSLSQSSVTFLLSAVVRLDGFPAQRVNFSPDAATKRRLLALIHANCG